MKILLLGAYGQVGWELQRSLAPLGELVALGSQGSGNLGGDLTVPKSLESTVEYLAPDVIVNAAAYTAVDRAESEPEIAEAINSKAPSILAKQANNLGAFLVHYSTDYVFDGSGDKPWRETDQPNPLNVYGQTKLQGERGIQESDCQYLIFRTSWVFSAHRHNFIRSMLRLASERDQLKVINDQIGSPTGAELIADVTAHALKSARTDTAFAGTYHLAATGETSWYEYAKLIIDAAGKHGLEPKATWEDIYPVPSEEFPTTAKRPRNSRLDIAKLQRTFGLHLPRWEQGVLRALQEIKPQQRA